jgi:hypothetical protein
MERYGFRQNPSGKDEAVEPAEGDTPDDENKTEDGEGKSDDYSK